MLQGAAGGIHNVEEGTTRARTLSNGGGNSRSSSGDESSSSGSSSSSASSSHPMAVVARVRSGSTELESGGGASASASAGAGAAAAAAASHDYSLGKPGLGIMETERLIMGGVDAPSSGGSSPGKRSSVAQLLSRLAFQLESLPRSARFALLVAGLFTFFGMHNFLQEKIMRFPGFNYGLFLGFLEVAGVTFFSHWERVLNGEAGVRRAPLRSYVATTLCLLGSSSLSNIALNYVNYPTKVVFRSCKLIPTMIISGAMNKRRFTAAEYGAAFAICVGLILFAFADVNVSPSFSPYGLLLVSLSVVCDSFLPNVQEKLFAAGSSRLEVTFYSNVFTLMAMTVSMLFSGDLVGATSYAREHSDVAALMLLYTLLAYVAISLHMQMLRSFGSVAAVIVGNARKAMTICASFVFFPKPFAMAYLWGGLLVLGGLTVSGYLKSKDSHKPNHSSSSSSASHSHSSHSGVGMAKP